MKNYQSIIQTTNTNYSRVGLSGFLAALALAVALFVSTAAVQTARADAGFTVTRVEYSTSGASRARAWLDAGARDGVTPGMRLEIFRGAALVGALEIVEAGPRSSVGVFISDCHMCAPAIGDIALRSAADFKSLPPPILVPQGTARPKQPPDSAFVQLESIFRAFMFDDTGDADDIDDESGKAAGGGERRAALPECPSESGADSDIDIASEVFPEPGDRVRVSGLGERPDFCPTIDSLGYIRLPDGLNVRTVRKTLAAAERDLNMALAERGERGGVKLSLSPPGAAPAKAFYFVSGAVSLPAVYEAAPGLTVGALIERAGGPAPDADGSVLVVEDLSQRWNMKLLKPEKPSAPPTSGTSHSSASSSALSLSGLDAPLDGGVVFLPTSPENLKAFIDEILGMLPDD